MKHIINMFNCGAVRLLVTALLLFVTSVVANADNFTAKNDDGVTIYYNILSSSDKTCKVTYCFKNSSLNAHAYTGVVVIPETVTYNRTVYSVTAIDDYAFYMCSGLTEVIIPESVTSIGSSAFDLCSGLTEVSIPGSVTKMYWDAFHLSTNIKTVIFEDGEETLTIPSLSGRCYIVPSFDSLKSLYLGRNMSYSNTSSNNKGYYSPFSQVTTLSTVTIGENVGELPDYLFYSCPGLTSITLPESITEIGNYAFQNCTGLKDVTIGENVTSIGDYALDSPNLGKVYSKATTPPNIKYSTFYDVDKVACTLYVPLGCFNPYWLHTYWGEFYNIVEMDFGETDALEYIMTGSKKGIVGYFTTEGKTISHPQKGVNIIRYSDGTAEKVLVK